MARVATRKALGRCPLPWPRLLFILAIVFLQLAPTTAPAITITEGQIVCGGGASSTTCRLTDIRGDGLAFDRGYMDGGFNLGNLIPGPWMPVVTLQGSVHGGPTFQFLDTTYDSLDPERIRILIGALQLRGPEITLPTPASVDDVVMFTVPFVLVPPLPETVVTGSELAPAWTTGFEIVPYEPIYGSGTMTLTFKVQSVDPPEWRLQEGVADFKPFLGAVADTFVRDEAPNTNEGASTFLRVSGLNRALVRFDQALLEDLAGGRRVASAILQMDIADNRNDWGRRGHTVDLHRMTMNWAEGNGRDAIRGDIPGATWNCAVDSSTANHKPDCGGATAWEMDSPNRVDLHPWVSEPSDTAQITNGLTASVEWDVTVDIRAFLAGAASNHGWIIKKTDDRQSGAIEFASRESGHGPRLAITFAEAVPGDILVVDEDAGIVRHYSPSGSDRGVFVSGLSSPAWIAADRTGHIYVSEFGGNAIRKFSAYGVPLLTVPTSFTPGGVAIGYDGSHYDPHIYVAHYDAGKIQRYNRYGDDVGLFASYAGCDNGCGTDFIKFNANGYLYVADFQPYGRVRLISPTGEDRGDFVTTNTPSGVEGLAFDATGNLYVSNYNNAGIIQKFSPTGADLGAFASPAFYGLGFDSDGNLYSAASGGPIEKFSSSGVDLGGFGRGGRDILVVPSRGW